MGGSGSILGPRGRGSSAVDDSNLPSLLETQAAEEPGSGSQGVRKNSPPPPVYSDGVLGQRLALASVHPMASSMVDLRTSGGTSSGLSAGVHRPSAAISASMFVKRSAFEVALPHVHLADYSNGGLHQGDPGNARHPHPGAGRRRTSKDGPGGVSLGLASPLAGGGDSLMSPAARSSQSWVSALWSSFTWIWRQIDSRWVLPSLRSLRTCFSFQSSGHLAHPHPWVDLCHLDYVPPIKVDLLLPCLTSHTYVSSRDDDSRVAYIAWFLFLVTDVSMLACVLPATSLLYALLTQKKSRTYWQVTTLRPC